MKRVWSLLTIGIFIPGVAAAQSGFTGSWQVAGETPRTTWTAVLETEGRYVIGAVSDCATSRPVEIFEGRFEADTIHFKCMNPRSRRVMLTGHLRGDEIDFVADIEVLDGPGAQNPMTGRFAGPQPAHFTAKRIPDAPSAVTELADHARRPPSVPFERILHADIEPQNWLTYSGTLRGERHSPLTQITAENVKHLELAWLWQMPVQGRPEATPLVVDGTMYTVRPTNDVVALNAATGDVIWTFPYSAPTAGAASGGGGNPNRGLAIVGNTLFIGTLDAHLLALDAFDGKLLWDTRVADPHDPNCGRVSDPCYVITHAPLVVKDKVIVGVGGGEGKTRGFVAAFDTATGKEAWRFYTIPGPDEFGHETWSGDSWKTGGAGVWATGAYDADLNLTYWGTGNPSPNYSPETRLGDNLYSNSVVALDADTGVLKWHYQFTPHDDQDWDSAQSPVLVDMSWQGRPRKVILWANRNGLMYVLDRTTGEFLAGKPFVEVNWMDGFDDKGRPIRIPGKVATPEAPLKPGMSPTNWQPSSYSPTTGLLYLTAWERPNYGPGGPAKSKAYGAVRAFDPSTLTKKWEFRVDDAVFWRGLLTTSSDLVFTGTWGDVYSDPKDARRADGYFYALNARSGEVLWKFGLGGSIQSPPMTYAIDGKQYVAVAGGNTMFVFALRE
jgi:alcohol dehydrogenase (cytochrome c)